MSLRLGVDGRLLLLLLLLRSVRTMGLCALIAIVAAVGCRVIWADLSGGIRWGRCGGHGSSVDRRRGLHVNVLQMLLGETLMGGQLFDAQDDGFGSDARRTLASDDCGLLFRCRRLL